MRRLSRLRAALGFPLLLALASMAPASADAPPGRFDPFADAAIEPRLGAAVPRGLRFADDAGAPVALDRYLGDGKPVILAPVDYDCGNICGVTLAGLFGAVEDLPFTAGEDFELVAVGMDPREGPDEAAAAKAEHLDRYPGAAGTGAGAGVHFLAGTGGSLADGGGGSAARLLDAIGFRYRYGAETDQFAHPAAVAVLTPEGRLARWLYGYPFEPDDLRLALTEAGGGAIGTFADRVWLLCFRYDPVTGAYTPAIWAGVRAAGVLGALALGGYILLMLRRERRRRGEPAAR